MIDILPPEPPGTPNPDLLTKRLLDAARVQDRRIEVPPLDVVKPDFAQRLADISANVDGAVLKKMTGVRGGWGQRARASMIWASMAVLLAIVGITYVTALKRDTFGAVWTYATANGQRGTLTLPDGSQVMLNVASRIEIPSDYKHGNRTIRLTGSAMFDVTHAHTSPFTVITGLGTIRVLGTRFIVRHYATDTGTTVTVQDGKVSVASTVLTAHQQVTIGSRGLSPVTAISADQYDIPGDIVRFRDVPLRDAIPDLNRWYDVDIRLGDATIAEQRVSGDFKAGSLTDLAAILTLMFDVSIVQQGRILTLHSRNS